jgi:ABC-type Zn uptake system ZnuABC Zn-binding protein ZnuA
VSGVQCSVAEGVEEVMNAWKCWQAGALLIVLLSSTGCTGQSFQAPAATTEPQALHQVVLSPGERLRVLATTSIVADVVAAVGGSRIEVSALVPPGVDPHAFEPTPQDVRSVAEAQVIFESGLGLEAFLGDLVHTAGGSVPIVTVSADIQPLPAGGHAAEEQNAAHVEWDPHVWLDPQNVILWTNVIEASLTALDPQGAAGYARAAEEYRLQLQALDAEMEAELSAIPQEQRRLVTDHQEFAYFARRYGFEVVGTVIPAPSAAAEPSARDLAALEDTIRSAGVRAVFVSSVVTPALARQVAQDTGIPLVTLYAHSLTDSSGPAPSYLALMRLNARRIAKALAG